MRISLSKKVLYAAIILCLVTVTSGVITYRFVNRVSENSLHVINVELPIEDALLGMDLELSETTRAVLDYVQDYKERHVRALFYSLNNSYLLAKVTRKLASVMKCFSYFPIMRIWVMK